MNHPLPDYILIILIVILTGLLTIISSKGNLLDFRYRSIRKVIKKKGWYFISISLVYGMVLVFQYKLNSKQQRIIENERRSKDSLIANGIRKGVDSASRDLFRKLSQAFSTQSLKIDSLKNEIIIIKDSVKTTNNYYSSPEIPVLQLNTDALEIIDSMSQLRTYKLRISIKDAGITNINFNTDLINYFQDGSFYSLRLYPTPKTIKLAKDTDLIKTFKIPTKTKPVEIYLHIHGSFESLNSGDITYIDDYYIYLFKTQKISFPLVDLRERVSTAFKSNF